MELQHDDIYDRLSCCDDIYDGLSFCDDIYDLAIVPRMTGVDLAAWDLSMMIFMTWLLVQMGIGLAP